MKKNILVICMLILLCFLSCDINALNELLGKAREKFLEENNKVENLKSIEENQEDKEKQVGIVKRIEKGVQQVVQAVPVVPVGGLNNEVFEKPVNDNNSAIRMYSQEEKIEIKKEDLVARTDEEKKAQVEIEKVKNLLKERSISSSKLIEDAHKLKNEYEQLEVDFHSIMSKIQTEVRSLRSEDYKGNLEKISKLNRLQNQLKISLDIERLMSQVVSTISELKSSEFFFNKAGETLTEAITKRLENEARKGGRYFFREVSNGLLLQLSRDSQRYARNALSQLESAVIKLNGAIGEKKNIKDPIDAVRAALDSL
ncbi:P12 family lipoprotein (plasmid) [Borrelia coriaceae]|nr:P12 family lipoprotein [Borrelia coriaceae]UPA17224.1 P12 family lipoprotein [Borrelia coriaceae]